MTVWTLRERVLLALLAEQGHAPIDDWEEGWACCDRCQTSWFIRKRAMIADGVEDDRRCSSPLSFDPCST